MQLAVEFINTGFCHVPEALVMTQGRWRWIEQPILVGLLHHPSRGTWLIDTGVHPRLARSWSRLFLILVGLKMVSFRVPETISGILLTHWHLDHTAGLQDFPKLPVIASRAGFQAAQGLESSSWLEHLLRLARGYDKRLIPDDISPRTQWLEDLPLLPVSAEFLGRDLFGDGSVMAVPLPGHAAGQHGFWFESVKLFYVADAIGHNKMLDDRVDPRVPLLISEDRVAERETRIKLRRLRAERPDIVVQCCHSPMRN